MKKEVEKRQKAKVEKSPLPAANNVNKTKKNNDKKKTISSYSNTVLPVDALSLIVIEGQNCVNKITIKMQFLIIPWNRSFSFLEIIGSQCLSVVTLHHLTHSFVRDGCCVCETTTTTVDCILEEKLFFYKRIK